MILPLFKPLGASTHQLAAAIGHQLRTKATHTGTLDPMATGVVVVLSGDDRLRKSELSSWQKRYVFQIVVGCTTDSHDLLGLPTPLSSDIPDAASCAERVSDIFPQYLKQYIQQVPRFSARRLQGTSAFALAREQVSFELPSETVEIFDLRLISARSIDHRALEKNISVHIGKVEGDFRQSEITLAWRSCLALRTRQEQSLQSFPLLTLSATVSKRTYIRGLVRDMSLQLELPMTTFSITRTHNGPFSLADCWRLPQVKSHQVQYTPSL